MASTIPNERRLRQITLATLFPAFPLIVASGVMSEKSNNRYGYWTHPVDGTTAIYCSLIPTFFSAFTSIISLAIKHDPLEKRPRVRTALWGMLDLILAASNLVILIFVWAFEPAAMYQHSDWMMLETYATVFLMSNMFIHGYLALYHPIKSLCSGTFLTKCPHCQGKLRSVETVGPKSGYSLLRAEDYLDEPEAEASAEPIRLSTDSEA
ncbi:uncharacterized protein N0V89_006767 [Didymosphaeria variabile]|uniref:Uncharacterized protein n=1 Tax=Didymosphaeria variabile TaxID=1932322 RepID=A0A9W8XK69_9PLEO|nr:uncharacterized protein N0V89_006767 [Didymosphaeria variabile]KAJ4351425.1 hypothetical protein N0V89_006767 [Didymosphaeria variabile]